MLTDSPLAGTRSPGIRNRRPRPLVRDYMTPRDALATVSPEATLREVAELLASRHVAGAPVLAGSWVVGVVSASDLMEFAATAPAAPADEWEEWDAAPEAEYASGARVSFLAQLWTNLGEEMADGFGGGRREANAFEEHTVAEVMTSRLVTVAADATLRHAADLMRREGVHRLLVLEGGRLAGLITSTDVLRAVADGR